MKYICVYIFFILGSITCSAQLDSLQQLAAVHIVDSKLQDFSDGYQVKKIPDSLLKENTYSLTDLLRFNSQIYFKENGYGGVSSPSFRGTNAAQTAVIWNGIAINSAFNGQTDFNTITTFSSSEVSIRPGGGSSQYGSGAVGGSVHLTNSISFKNQQQIALQTSVGSFDTYTGKAVFTKSSHHYFVKLAVDYIDSENDYVFVGKDQQNQNGQFNHLNIAVDAGIRFKNSTLSYYSNYYDGERGFAGTLNVIGKDGYDNLNVRNLLSYSFKKENWKSVSKAAYLVEKFTYYTNLNLNESDSYGKSFQFIADQQVSLKLNENLQLGGILNYTRIDAKGANIGSPNRNTLAAVLFAKHNLLPWLRYNIHLRQEGANEFNNPLLIAVDGIIKLSDKDELSFNLSKNYRVPTFNDLFWNTGGNVNLNPETSRLLEAGYNYSYKFLKLSLATYFIATRDMIKWQPNAMGIWSPTNIQRTNNYGVEVGAEYQKKLGKTNWVVAGNYAFTKAVDQNNNKQLIYVPYHKVTNSLIFQRKKISGSFQSLYNGDVFITSDNKNQLDGYFVLNAAVKCRIFDKRHKVDIGFSIQNILNNYYENVATRPLPGVNYTLNFNYKF